MQARYNSSVSNYYTYMYTYICLPIYCSFFFNLANMILSYNYQPPEVVPLR